MDEDLKKDLKALARNAERRAAASLLRWKYKREGKAPPDPGHLEFQSGVVAERARRVIQERSKAVWKGMKDALETKKGQEDHKD